MSGTTEAKRLTDVSVLVVVFLTVIVANIIGLVVEILFDFAPFNPMTIFLLVTSVLVGIAVTVALLVNRRRIDVFISGPLLLLATSAFIYICFNYAAYHPIARKVTILIVVLVAFGTYVILDRCEKRRKLCQG